MTCRGCSKIGCPAIRSIGNPSLAFPEQIAAVQETVRLIVRSSSASTLAAEHVIARTGGIQECAAHSVDFSLDGTMKMALSFLMAGPMVALRGVSYTSVRNTRNLHRRGLSGKLQICETYEAYVIAAHTQS